MQGVGRTYGGGQDWKLTLRGILKLDPAGEEVAPPALASARGGRDEARLERSAGAGPFVPGRAVVNSRLRPKVRRMARS